MNTNILLTYLTFSLFIISCKEEVPPSIETEIEVPKILDCNCDSTIQIENTSNIEGYSNQISYYPGDTIQLYIHSITPNYSISFIEQTINPNNLLKINNTSGEKQNYNQCAYKNGPNWKKSYELTLPKGIKSNYATIKISNKKGSFNIPIIIKNKKQKADLLCIASTNTWHAYNMWGGASFYRFNANDTCQLDYSNLLSLKRPIDIITKLDYKGHLFSAELGIIHWLEREMYSYDIITDKDLHNDSSILQNYKTVLLNTHSEYWTENGLNYLEKYLNSNGNLMYISANGLYWKVTMKSNQIECQKEGNRHIQDSTIGGLWRSGELSRPEEKTIGIAYDRTGANTFTPYMVYNDTHWVFKNTHLKNGDLFGKSLNRKYASGHETDKKTNLSPNNTQLLARGLNQEAIDQLGDSLESRNGGAEMIYFQRKNGGQVFSTGSITSGGSPLVDSSMHQILHNVLNEFLK